MNTELTITLNEIESNIELAKSIAESTKNSFVEVIENKDIPLDVRWDLWVSAPSEMKERQRWIVHFKNLPDDLIGIDGPIWAERRETVYCADIIDRLLEENEYLRIDTDLISKINIDALREEILEMNLECFDYDW